MKIAKANFYGSPHIGIFCIATDEIALVPLSTQKNLEHTIRETLSVDVVRTNLSETSLLGVFAAANSEKIVVADILEKEEKKVLRDVFSEVVILDERYTAVGNLLAMNDHGVACSEFIGKGLKDAVGLKVADSDLVGSAIFVNNNGFLCHRDASEEEIKKIEHVFKVKGDSGTMNLGDPFVKTGIVGNRHGVLVGSATSGPELNKVDEIFTK